jgi:hypothetical protein
VSVFVAAAVFFFFVNFTFFSSLFLSRSKLRDSATILSHIATVSSLVWTNALTDQSQLFVDDVGTLSHGAAFARNTGMSDDECVDFFYIIIIGSVLVLEQEFDLDWVFGFGLVFSFFRFFLFFFLSFLLLLLKVLDWVFGFGLVFSFFRFSFFFYFVFIVIIEGFGIGFGFGFGFLYY